MKPVIMASLSLAVTTPAFAQQAKTSSADAVPVVALVDVSVITMNDDHVEPGQTVVVRGDRIVAIRPAGDASIPKGAVVIDGAGRYLVPGLTDAHVHLAGLPFAPTRPDFGDAPLYLAFGVTSVINLRGTPTHLEWKRRIEAGELLGPTIYTSGEFVDEPRVSTPEEAQQEVDEQVRDGYDVIKFREVVDSTGRTITSRGLSLPAYQKLNEAARSAGIPLVGHAPINLGLDALLQARQPLAHMGALSNVYFLPLQGNTRFLAITGAALLALITVVTFWGLGALIGRWRAASPRRSPALSRIRILTGRVLVAGVIAVVCAALFLPGGPLFESRALRLLFTVVVLSIAVATVPLGFLTIRTWKDESASSLARVQASVVSVAALALASALAVFWVPVAWRSSDAGIERLAARVRDSGISVQTTLINYDFLSGPERLAMFQEPAIEYLDEAVQTRWRRLPRDGRPGYRYHLFMKRVTAALHKAGVPLVAGTDAMGFPLIVPGASLHRELQLLTESGLTPYEAIRAATVNPALFLGKDKEFGTVAEGKRADLLLVDGNPLQDLTRLKHPVGVMVRGKWLTREDLRQRLAALTGNPIMPAP
jgi:hypothetical protein